MMWLAGTGVRVARFASSSSHSTSSMPCATVFFVPPVSWMLNACSAGARVRRRAFLLHQAADLVGLAAEADDDAPTAKLGWRA